MTEEIIIDKENKTKKHRNNEIDCLHFGCRKGENGNVLFWCDFYDDHCDNYTGCYYRKCLRLEQERDELKFENDRYKQLLKGCPTEDEDCGLCVIDEQNKRLKQENKALQAYKDINEDFKQAWDELNKKYTEVLKLAKTNADSNEYCLQELERENRELKNIIKIHDSTKYDYYKLMKENEEWHIKYAGCNTANSAIQEENNKYHSALEEIREIAEKYKDMEGCRIPLGAIKMTVDEVLK